MQTLIKLIQHGDLKGLLQHYGACDEEQKLSQLKFLYQQGQKYPEKYEFYQQLANKFIEKKGMIPALIGKIAHADLLGFFTPGLKEDDNFKLTDVNQRNVLHYLFTAEQVPFTYLRALMLFESNEALNDALCQQDKQGLTPIETYLTFNQNINPLPAHEFTALLAMIEIQSKTQPIKTDKLKAVVKTIKQRFATQKQTLNDKSQRLTLTAIYYNKPVERLL